MFILGGMLKFLAKEGNRAGLPMDEIVIGILVACAIGRGISHVASDK